ncbi:MAG: DUF5615 family PIN-like protein [Pyrinomonadaceae bacterium]|nr:DUF5615 family PIN-like protein [Pyrinomonadaceae bacterium]
MIAFLADEHIPFATIRKLREAGFTVVSVSEEYTSATDEAILQIANERSLVILTNDSDFGDLIFRDNLPFTSGLIYFRLEQFRPEEMSQLLLMHIRELGSEFENRFSIISRRKFRQRRL